MFSDMLNQIYAFDCKTPGVSYKVCGKFFLPFCDCLAIVISERGLQGSPEEKRIYSLFDLKTLSVVSRDSDRYLSIVKSLPDYTNRKLTSTEPFKKWHYIKDFEDLLSVYSSVTDGNPYEVIRDDYIALLSRMKGIKDVSMHEIYDYFISIA